MLYLELMIRDNMKHLFIPYDLAVLAKEKGFNEACIGMYLENKNLYSLSNSTSDFSCVTNENRNDTFTAPLYQQIIDWFREKHKIWIWIEDGSEKITFYNISTPNIKVQNTGSNYHEALNKAIEEAFKLI